MSKRTFSSTVVLAPRDRLLFEAGIKLGTIFHQFIGTPVALRTARLLARSIEAAVRLQPYVRQVKVRLYPGRGGPLGKGCHAYRYLTAEMLEATVVVELGTDRVTATLLWEERMHYPLMRVVRFTTGRVSRGQNPPTVR